MVDQVKDLDPRNQYTATAGQTIFPYTFPIFDKDDLVVIQEGATLTEGTDYTVSGVGDEDGGNVTLTTGATVGDTITIYRDIALERLVDYQDSGDFLASDVNDDFDRQIFMIQQLNRDVQRGLRFSQDDEIASTQIGNLNTRANKLLAFDASGELTYQASTTLSPVADSLVDTVASAKALNLAIGDYVRTGGYTSFNDGGGALYRVVGGSTGTDDGTIYHDMPNGNQLQLVDIENINAKQTALASNISGTFRYNSSRIKTDHDGGMVIDPTVPFYTLGDETSVNLWFDGDPTHTTNGVLERKIDETVLDEYYGVISNSSFVYNEGFVNRKAYETMLRNTDFNDFTFVRKADPVFVWGSINVGRSNMTIRHLMGCDIRGRYSDPSEAASGQAGHMFGFVNYTDPYPGTDYTNAGVVENVNYILDGEASTIFDAGHTNTHNNNVIAFFNTKDCSVTGMGGIGASDHNGIAFDGDCVNPRVDVAYITNYDNRAVTMKGTSGTEDSAWVKVGSISGATGAGSTKEAIICQDYRYAKVEVGTADLFSTTESHLLRAYLIDKVDVQCGYVQDCQFVVNIDECGELYFHDTTYSNVTYLVRRGGTSPAPTPQKRVIFDRITCKDSANHTLYLSQVASGAWDEFRVKDCDLSGATGTLTPYSGYLSASGPSVFNFRNNKVPSGWVYDSKIWNKQLDRPNTSVGSSSFTYDFAGTNGDQPYEWITIICTHSGDSYRHQIQMNLRDLLLTSTDYRVSTTADTGDIIEITTVKTGTSVQFTATASAGTATISSYSLGN